MEYVDLFYYLDVASGLQVAVLLWVASYIGSLFNFLTLAYIGKLFAGQCIFVSAYSCKI
jgi:hypothetical protein